MISLSRSISALPLSLLAILLSAGLWGPSAVHAQHPTEVTSIINSAQDTTLEVNHNGSLLVPGTLVTNGTENDSISAEGAGTRLLWYPAKAAFRAGRVGARSYHSDVWDADSIGRYSVAFGVDTKASGYVSTAMGGATTASGGNATAMGGGTTASGENATAMGLGTTASGDEATAMGSYTTPSGVGATAMGFATTAATDNSLSIGKFNNANSGSSGDGTLFVAGNGSNNSSRSDALVVDKSGNLAIEGTFTDDLGTFAGDFEVSKSGSNRAGHAVLVENAGGQGADALAIQTGADDQPDDLNNFISFYDGNGTPIGAIEGNGTGGINTRSGSADFAEELPVKKGDDAPEPASLVGVTSGTVTLETEGAERVMITSTAPIMTGNATTETAADDDRRVAVAFVGQVPVNVRGPAEVGDLIVPSGKNDGTARALVPSAYRRSEHGPIAGQAWSAKSTDDIGEVTVAVGLGRSGTVAKRMEEQQSQIAALRSENETINERLAALEAERTSTLAGLGGSAGLLFFGLLLGGLLGAGLLWRRQNG